VPLTALGLILVAAITHAGWNLVLKQAKQKLVFMWWALVVGTLCFLFLLTTSPPLPSRIWPYAISSALAEAAYYFALTWAYDIDDFSLIYPLARGAAPVLLVLWATLFLGEYPRPTGLLGIALLVLGLIVVGSGGILSRRGKMQFSTKGIIAAICAASCISIYTAIDGAAVRFVSPTPYTVLLFILSVIFVAPAILWRYGYRAAVIEWRTNWPRIILVGILSVAAYILILQAYALSRVSYAGAVREISVVFAAFIGWRWLGESFGMTRIVGAILIFIGIIVIAIIG
jgi:drug/metabolite transporter (DMT)-like permease